MSVIEAGVVTTVDPRQVGSPVVMAATAGDTVVFVNDNADFTPGDEVLVTALDADTGELYIIDSIDDEAGITLTTALSDDLPVDSWVAATPLQTETIAMVRLAESGEVRPCIVLHTLMDALRSGLRDEDEAETVLTVHAGDARYVFDIISRKPVRDIEGATIGENTTLQDLINQTVEAFDFAEASNAVFRQTTPPDPGDVIIRINDTWFDTDNSNKPYRWDGSSWVDATQSWLTTNPSASFPNVVISPAGLAAYNSGGVAVTTINSSDGTLTTSGSVWVAGDISGATVTGGVLQSTATAARGIKINSAGFAAYNSGGSPTLAIDAATGAITMTGGLISGGTVTSTSGGSTATLSSGMLTFAGVGGGGYILSGSGYELAVQGGGSIVALSSLGIDLGGTINPTAGDAHFASGISANGAIHAAASLFDDSLNGGGGTGANINNNGKIIRTPPSSARFKTGFEPLTFDPQALRQIEGVSFLYKDPEKHGGGRQVGLLAEGLLAVGLGAFVTRDAAGEITGILYDRLIIALLPWMRDLTTRVERLEDQ